MVARATPESFWANVDRTEPCWTWTGRTSVKGYSRVRYHGVMVMAHRLAYELTNGPIPDGMVLDHLCRNRACVNPSHLEVVTIRENNLRGVSPWAVNARKTSCPQGHPLHGSNLRIEPGTGRRRCRTCERAYYHRTKGDRDGQAQALGMEGRADRRRRDGDGSRRRQADAPLKPLKVRLMWRKAVEGMRPR